MKNQISKSLIFISKFAKTVRIFLASIQLSANKNLPVSENRPPGENQQKESRNPRNNGLQLSFGTLERTLTSDLPLRRRLLYTTELLGHINYGAYDYAKKDLNELPLRRRTLYPGELRKHCLYSIQRSLCCQEKDAKNWLFSNFLFTDDSDSAIIN